MSWSSAVVPGSCIVEVGLVPVDLEAALVHIGVFKCFGCHSSQNLHAIIMVGVEVSVVSVGKIFVIHGKSRKDNRTYDVSTDIM